MASSAQPHLSSTAQQYLDILDITNDLLLLRDGSTALIMKVSAINFGLLSEPEQDAIIYAYAALINSLSFPIQILIKSKPKDVTNYLNYIDQQLEHAPNDMRRQQIASYRQFVANLITEQNVLDKSFYVVLPLTALELGLATAANPFGDLVPNKKAPHIDRTYVIEKSLTILNPRRDHMVAQFGRLGLRANQLDTKELIHLFYTTYNSQASEGARVVETREYTSALIQTQGSLPTAPVYQPQPIPAEPTVVATQVPTQQNWASQAPVAGSAPVAAAPAAQMPPVQPAQALPIMPQQMPGWQPATPQSTLQQAVSAIPQETIGFQTPAPGAAPAAPFPQPR